MRRLVSEKPRWLPWVAVPWIAAIVIAAYRGVAPSWLGASAHLASYAGDLAILGLLLAAACTLGRGLLFLLKPRGLAAGEGALLSLGLGLGLLALLGLLVGALGGYYPALTWVVLGLLGAGTLLPAGLRLARGKEALTFAGVSRATWGLGGFDLLLVAGALAVLGYILVVNALAPPLEWDSVAYHLALPRLYLRQHSLSYVPFIVHSNWPSNLEMLYTWSLLLGSEAAAQLLTAALTLMTSWGIYLLCLPRFGARAGLWGAVLYLFAPVVYRYSGTAAVDLGVTFFGVLALLAAARGLESGGARWWLLAGLLAGFAAGTKLTGAAIAISVVAALLLDSLLRLRSHRRGWLGHLARLIGLAGVALLAASPWYLRSYLNTGNPVWPFLDGIFPSRNWDALGSQLHNAWLRDTGVGVSWGSFLWLPWDLAVNPQYFGLSLGFLWLGALPFLVFYRGNHGRLLTFLFFACSANVAIWYLLTQQSRFLSLSIALLNLLAAVSLAAVIGRAGSPGRAVASLAMVASLALSFPYWQPGSAELLAQRLPYVLGAKPREALLSESIRVMPVFEYVNQELAPNAKILLLPYENRGYYLEREYFWGNPISQRLLKFEAMADGQALWQQARDMGFTHVLYNPEVDVPNMAYEEHYQRLLADFLRPPYVEPLFSANGATLFRLRASLDLSRDLGWRLEERAWNT